MGRRDPYWWPRRRAPLAWHPAASPAVRGVRSADERGARGRAQSASDNPRCGAPSGRSMSSGDERRSRYGLTNHARNATRYARLQSGRARSRRTTAVTCEAPIGAPVWRFRSEPKQSSPWSSRRRGSSLPQTNAYRAVSGRSGSQRLVTRACFGRSIDSPDRPAPADQRTTRSGRRCRSPRRSPGRASGLAPRSRRRGRRSPPRRS